MRMTHYEEYYDFCKLMPPVQKEKVREVVNSYFKVRFAQSKHRTVQVTTPRQILMYCLYVFTDLKLKAIALEAGRTDHTTVLHSVKTVRGLCDSYEDFRKKIIEIESMIE